MNRKSIVMSFVLTAAILLPAGLQAQAAPQAAPASPAPTKTHRVVFGLTSGDEADWRLTLGNLRNLLVASSPDSQIEVVAYGPGLSFVKKGSSAEQEILALIAKQVHFVACQNAMRMQHVTEADLIPGVGTVPAGIVEVITRQEQGWSYIKAGR